MIFLLYPHWEGFDPWVAPAPPEPARFRQGLFLSMVEASNAALNQVRRDFKQVPVVLQPARPCKGVICPR